MIGRITTQMTQQMILANIEQDQDQIETTQQQLSSGKRINQPSDDPYGTSLAMQLNGQLSDLTNYTNNVNDGTAWAQQTMSSLSDMTNMIQRVQELVEQASSGTMTQADLTASASEVSQLSDAIKQEANTQYDGQYIFSGAATTTAPYQTGSDNTYYGDDGAINRLIGPGTQIQVNTDITQLLGTGSSTPGGLLETLQNIVGDMNSGDQTALQTDSQALTSNLNTAEAMQASAGSIADRLQMASSRIQDTQTNVTAALSNDQDVDMAATITNFSTEQAAFQAALQSGASIVQESLLNFLGTTS